MLKKISEIIDGWKNLTLGVTTQEAKKRSEICGACPAAVWDKWMQKILGSKEPLKEVNGYVCNECGCPLSAKIRSEKAQCPLDKWETHDDKRPDHVA